MRHHAVGRKFGRLKGKRKSFVQGLISNLIMENSIMTTEARAKEIRPRVEKLVTLAKKSNIASLRILLKRLPRPAAMRLYYDVAPRYKERKGGYTRIIKAGRRMRDAAPKACIQFV